MTASGRVEVAASTAAVWSVLTDLDALAELAEEFTGHRWRRGTEVAVGARFDGANSHGGKRWRTRCTVVEVVPERRFAFEVATTAVPLRLSRWEYSLTPTEHGCLVVETSRDLRRPWVRLLTERISGVPDRERRNQANIERTLGRLRDRLGAPDTGRR